MKIIACNSFFVSILLLYSINFSLSAQEKLVPFFPEKKIVTIDKNYAKKMSLFTEYENFKDARLFLTPEGKFALEIFYEQGDTLYKDRTLLTEDEKDAYLRDMVRQYAFSVGAVTANKAEENAVSDSLTGKGIAANQSTEGLALLNQRGRSTMLVMNTIAGLGYYGYALPLTLKIEDDRGFVGLYMLASGASFYIPYRITQRQDVTLAQASLNFYGISRGAMHGIFLGEILTNNPDYYEYFEDYNLSQSQYERQERLYDEARDKHTSALFGMGIVGSVSGGIAGFKLADRWGYNGGSTSIFQMWGDVGTISGLLLSDVFNFWDNEEMDATFGTAMLTSVAGMVGGKFFGDSRNYTLGDAIVYRSTIALSAMPLLTIVDYFEPEDETAYTVAGLAGIAAGGYLGWKATLNKDFDTSDGVYIALGEIAGGALGLGLGYLISPDFNSQLIFTTATLGALGGYSLMYSTLSKNAISLAKNSNLDIKLQMNPIGFMMNHLTDNISPALASMYQFGSLKIKF